MDALLLSLVRFLGRLAALLVGSLNPLESLELGETVPDDFSGAVGVPLSDAAEVSFSSVDVSVSTDTNAGSQINLSCQRSCFVKLDKESI